MNAKAVILCYAQRQVIAVYFVLMEQSLARLYNKGGHAVVTKTTPKQQYAVLFGASSGNYTIHNFSS
jgi:hypothetical protein